MNQAHDSEIPDSGDWISWLRHAWFPWIANYPISTVTVDAHLNGWHLKQVEQGYSRTKPEENNLQNTEVYGGPIFKSRQGGDLDSERPFTNRGNGKISIITLKQTRQSPLSLFYLMLQIQQAVNRLLSIRQEPYFHNRVGVKYILQQPRAGDCQNKTPGKGGQSVAWEQLVGYTLLQNWVKRNSWQSW